MAVRSLICSSITQRENGSCNLGGELAAFLPLLKEAGSQAAFFMGEAHPSITPLNFRITPEELKSQGWDEKSVQVYDIVRRRALAAMAPRPILEECRRVLMVQDILIALGWRKILEKGWHAVLPEQPLPEPAIPDSATEMGQLLDDLDIDLDVVQIIDVTIDKPECKLTMSDTVELMRQQEIGRPSTYARAIDNLVKKGWLEVSEDGVKISPHGLDALQQLLRIEPLLDASFTQKLEEQLDKIDSGILAPSEAMKSLSSIISEADIKNLHWLDTVGEPFAGEPAYVAYARRDREPVHAPPVFTVTDDPERMLPPDDPVRLARDRFHAAMLAAHGINWWRLSSEERASYMVEAVLEVVNAEPALWEKRIRYDALLRWCLGITTGIPERTTERYRLWLLGLSTETREQLRASALEVAQAVRL